MSKSSKSVQKVLFYALLLGVMSTAISCGGKRPYRFAFDGLSDTANAVAQK